MLPTWVCIDENRAIGGLPHAFQDHKFYRHSGGDHHLPLQELDLRDGVPCWDAPSGSGKRDGDHVHSRDDLAHGNAGLEIPIPVHEGGAHTRIPHDDWGRCALRPIGVLAFQRPGAGGADL